MKISRNTLSTDKKLSQPQNTPAVQRADGFSQQFQSARHSKDDAHLNELLKKIKKKGEQVIKTQSIRGVHEYKLYIKEYLSFILKSSYRVKESQSPWGLDPLSMIAVIDKELDELGRMMLDGERDTLALVKKIDSIEGLLIDVYQ